MYNSAPGKPLRLTSAVLVSNAAEWRRRLPRRNPSAPSIQGWLPACESPAMQCPAPSHHPRRLRCRWGRPPCQFSPLGDGPSIRVLPFLLLAAFFMHAKAFPLSASAGTALPPWPITIALVVAVVIALADGRGPVDKCGGDLLAVQPMATSWAKPPITADGSAVPHTIPPWVIAGRVRGSHNRKCRDWFAGIKRCDTDLSCAGPPKSSHECEIAKFQ